MALWTSTRCERRMWRKRVRQRRTQLLCSIRGSILGPRERTRAPACIEPSIFSLLDARLERSPLIVAKWIRKN